MSPVAMAGPQLSAWHQPQRGDGRVTVAAVAVSLPCHCDAGIRVGIKLGCSGNLGAAGQEQGE